MAIFTHHPTIIGLIIERYEQPSLRFDGFLVGSVNHEAYSDGRGVVFALYKTIKGTYIGVCKEDGVEPKSPLDLDVKICHSLEDVYNFFGNGHLARKLYAVCGLDYTITIE